MTRYRMLEVVGTVIAVLGLALVGLGGASLLLNLSSAPWARAGTCIVAGVLLYAGGRAVGKVGERHLQQPVHQ